MATYTNESGRFTIQVPRDADGADATNRLPARITPGSKPGLSVPGSVPARARRAPARNAGRHRTGDDRLEPQCAERGDRGYGAELNRVPQPNIEDATAGQGSGAVITQNCGAPGGGVQVQIRGSNTVNGAYQPLYVVDGVIVNNDAYSTA